MPRFRQTLAAALLAAPLPALPALAAGEDTTPVETECPEGEVYDESSGECVDARESDLDAEELYRAGRALAEAGSYGAAITVLSRAASDGDPRVLNYLGYAHRMQERVTVGLGYYREALAIDPDFVLAREYMGEAYLQLDDVAAARTQLGEIEARCGAACPEYTALARRIAAHVKG